MAAPLIFVFVVLIVLHGQEEEGRPEAWRAG